jgi:branched-chain amino acid transport system ATP-binding protein
LISLDSDVILRVENVSKSFGGIRALNGASLSVKRGMITGLIGPNGSGKSTLFNIISGSEGKFGGKIFFEGKQINDMSPHKIFDLGLGRTFQTPRLFTGMSVLENSMLAARDQKGESPFFAPFPSKWEEGEIENAKRARDQLKALEIDHLYGKLSSEISGGQMKLLQLANVFAGNPKMLLLDEPTAGVAPRLAQDIFASIEKQCKEKGTTFFIIEHRLQVLFKHVQQVYVMHQGKIISEGTPSEVIKNRDVIDAYLGA